MAVVRTRTSRKGKPQYQVQIRKKGYAPTTKTFKTKAAADKWVTMTESEMISGTYVDRSEAEATTLKEALERYRDNVTSKKRGAVQETTKINKLLRHPLAKRSLAFIKSADIALYRDELLKDSISPDGKVIKKSSPSTIQKYLAILSHLYTVAGTEWNMPLPNPCKQVTRPKVSNARERRFVGKEEARILEYLGTRKNKWLKPIFELALETAMRESELLSLQWQHINFENKTAFLPKTKNDDSRTVPLSNKARAILLEIKVNAEMELKEKELVSAKRLHQSKKTEPQPLKGIIFHTTQSAIVQAWTRACEHLGIENLHFHDTRHEATTRLSKKLPNVIELSAMSGHKNLKMLQRYYHVDPTEMAEKLD